MSERVNLYKRETSRIAADERNRKVVAMPRGTCLMHVPDIERIRVQPTLGYIVDECLMSHGSSSVIQVLPVVVRCREGHVVERNYSLQPANNPTERWKTRDNRHHG